MEKHILSKSTYIKGEQCLKQLYLHKKRPFLRDRMPAERLAIFKRGTDVGVFAQELFPGGIDAGPKHYSQYQKAVKRTAELIEQGQEVIYEAAFQAHKTLILLDILVKNGDAWDAYEVKSSKSLSETYYKDAALQYHVLTESGLAVNSFSLIHINTEYELQGAIDIRQLFVITDVTEEVQKRSEQVAQKIEDELTALAGAHSPKIEIGPHCYAPYDCDFIGHCWKKVARPAIFDIPALSRSEQFALYAQCPELKDCLEKELPNPQAQMQIRSQLEQAEFIDREALPQYIPAFEEALLLKVLHFAPAMPLYEGTKPYQPIAFAYALQKLNRQGEVELIDSYIHKDADNPCEVVKARLDKLIDTEFPVFTYSNTGLESDDFTSIDLSRLLQDGVYYHPKIVKDYSSKSLGPAVGVKAAWKSIDMDVVAAQYYDDIRRQSKKAEEYEQAIAKYLMRELEILRKFLKRLR